MEKKSLVQETLWPIIEPDDRLPIPPAAWAAINLVALLVIAIPFVFIVGMLAASLWFANEMRETLELHVAHGAPFSMIAINALKLAMVTVAGRMAYIVVSCVPYIIREGRHGLHDYLRDYDPF